MDATVATTIGVLELGILIAAILLGVNLLQVWNYYRVFPEDPVWMQSLVAATCALDSVHSALLFHAIWHYTVSVYGQGLGSIVTMIWSLNASVFFSSTTTFIVQAFFSFRVWKVTQSRLLGLSMSLLSLVHFAFYLGAGAEAVISANFTVFSAKYYWGVVCALAAGAAVDITIAVALCVALMRKRSPYAKTNKILDKLVTFTISTGLFTSLFAMGELITFLTMPDSFAYLACLVVLMKMYPNSLLASLNERSHLRNQLTEGISLSRRSAPAEAAPSWNDQSWSRHRGDNVIELTTEVTVVRDADVMPKAEADIDSVFQPFRL